LYLALVLLATSALVAAEVRPRDWPQYRGGAQDGKAPGDELPPADSIGLELIWKRPLGSGFSGIVVADGKVLTMFTDGDDDVLAAFAASDGAELWRYRVDKKFPAVGGSSDGPLSTPLVADGVVYGLGPWGRLFAVRLKDGSELWAKSFGEGEAVKPRFGFTTAPVLAGGVLVVQTGGPSGHSISGFDPATGERRWSYADDPVDYQSPLAFEHGDRTLVMAVNDELFLGLEPATGEVLWQREHGLGGGHALPLDLGDSRVLVNGLREAVAYAVHRNDGVWNAEELWRSRSLTRTWALPVLYQGHLYGFTSRFLTCVDAATGEEVWKSRPPGGRGLILVGDQLAMIDPKGDLVLAAASPEGYRETARIRALGEGSYTAPSYAGGIFFARNLRQLAAVRVTDSPAPRRAGGPEVPGAFGEFLRGLAGRDDAAAALAAHLEGQELPLIEDGGLVHFVYRGPAEDAAVVGVGLEPGSFELAMTRIDGTDVWVRSVRLDPTAYRRYRLTLDFGRETLPDPGNPHRGGEGESAYSELRMPGWRPPAHLAEPEGERGRLEPLELGGREVHVYLPPGYRAEGAERYPLLIVNHGDRALAEGHLDRALDNLIGRRIEPLIAAFVPPASRREYRDDSVGAYARFLAAELIPALEQRYRLRPGAAERAIAGVADGGFAALYAAYKTPGVYGGAAAQSLLAGADQAQALADAIAAAGDAGPRRLYLDWTPFDRRPDLNRKLAATLERHLRPLPGQEVDGTPEWWSWAAHADRLLETLFPLSRE